MKKILLILAVLSFNYCCEAQQKDYRVVFDMSSGDSVSQQALVREVDIIKTSSPEANVEVVVYGKGLSLIIKDKSMHTEAIQKLLAMKDVSFKVCSITMQRNKVDKTQLITGVEPVPDGIYELISKQREGWGYIKVAH
jgi:intracellular sulfur oxidation DsrE/DsrF family protein